MVFDSGAEIYRALGVTPAIVASGTTTMYGGSKLRPEVVDIMEKASRTMIHLDDLNVAAGRVIAEITGAESGLVTSGAAGGLVLQAAAVMAGKDPASMARLPNADGLKNEIVMHKSHRFPYDQCYTSTGAKIVDIGDGRRCQPWELEAAINENTAAVAYLFSGFVTRRAIPLEQVVEIAHARERARNRRCRVVPAAKGQPSPVHRRRRRHGAVLGRQGRPWTAGHRHPRRTGRPHRGRIRQRQPSPVHRSRHEGGQRGDCRASRGAAHLRKRRRRCRDAPLHRDVSAGRRRPHRDARPRTLRQARRVGLPHSARRHPLHP